MGFLLCVRAEVRDGHLRFCCSVNSWTVNGLLGDPASYISVELQGRTIGWLGFGLRKRIDSGNGMIDSDFWMASVDDFGNATAIDKWSDKISMPLNDAGKHMLLPTAPTLVLLDDLSCCVDSRRQR